jgi:hypothetical protein
MTERPHACRGDCCVDVGNVGGDNTIRSFRVLHEQDRSASAFWFGYIYWHGQDHCWDATPTRRHHRIQNVQRNRQVHEVQRKSDQPKWHDSMSEMLPDDQPVRTTVQAPWVDRWVDFEPPQLPIAARWVDIVQVKSPPVIERKPEPVISPRTVMLVFIAIALALTLATIELLFRGMIHE